LAISGIAVPASAHAQAVTVSGIVVEREQPTPIGGAVIRLTGFPQTTTDLDGRFRLDQVMPGRYTLSIEAFGYIDRSLELLIRADTTLRLELDPDPVVLDSILVSTGTVTIKGNIRDGASGLKLVSAAQVTVYPGARTVGAMSGSFTLQDIPRDRPISLLIEAFEYLPARVELVAQRDTTLDVALAIDSVAMRMIAQQVRRIVVRAQAIPLSIRDMGRDEIRRSVVMSLGEFIARSLRVLPDQLPGLLDECVFYDDMRREIEDLIHLPPESIERVEIFGFRGRMVRVYSRKYVASLMGGRRLVPITFMEGGRATVCW
jgi:hypothetical protein